MTRTEEIRAELAAALPGVQFNVHERAGDDWTAGAASVHIETRRGRVRMATSFGTFDGATLAEVIAGARARLSPEAMRRAFPGLQT